jgi:hypothetical protein
MRRAILALLSFSDWKVAAGTGLRVGWNQLRPCSASML